MRVLLVGRGQPETGGIASYLDELHRFDDGGELEMQFLNLTRTGDMGSGGSFSLRNLGRTISDTIGLFRTARSVDVVHVHSALAPTSTLVRAGLFIAAARVRRRPIVVHAHGGRLVSYAEGRANRMLIRWALRGASRVIAVSQGVYEVLERELEPGMAGFVGNGVDTARFLPAAGRRDGRLPTILYVGHLSERKGVLDLVAASDILRAQGVEHRLVLVGGRPDEGDDEHRRVLQALETAHTNTELIGAVGHGEMPDIYASADVFCLPSWWEAMPLSILEAMACGLPVVASNVGDVASVIEDGSTGFVVEPKNPEQLASSLGVLLDAPDLRSSMGTAARRRAIETFAAEQTHHQVADIYREVLR